MKSLPLQARNRQNNLKHMPTNKTNVFVMPTSTTQTSLGQSIHSLTRAFASDPLLCLSAHKGGAFSQGLRQKKDLRLPAPPDKHALAQACYCMLVAHNYKMSKSNYIQRPNKLHHSTQRPLMRMIADYRCSYTQIMDVDEDLDLFTG